MNCPWARETVWLGRGGDAGGIDRGSGTFADHHDARADGKALRAGGGFLVPNAVVGLMVTA